MKKRLLSILLAMVMVISLMPTTALATGGSYVFMVTGTYSGSEQDFYYSTFDEAMAGINNLSGNVYVRLLRDYNAGTLDFEGKALELNLYGSNLTGEVVNAQNVTVIDNYSGTKGKLAATGTYQSVPEELVDTGSYELSLGTNTVTVSKKNQGKCKVTYVKTYDSRYGGTSFDETYAEEVWNEGDSITLKNGIGIGDVTSGEGNTEKIAAFSGWMINGKKYSEGERYTLKGDTTITTAWAPYHAVTYSVMNPTVEPGEPATYTEYVLDQNSTTLWGAKAGQVTFQGYTLSKWVELDGTEHDPGQTYTPTASVELKAEFVQSSCSIKYMNGQTTVATKSANIGNEITLNGAEGLEAPSSDYPVFDGWLLESAGKKLEAGGTYTVNASDIKNGEITFKATWTAAPKTYNVTYYNSLKNYQTDKANGKAVRQVAGLSSGDTVRLPGTADLELAGAGFIGWLDANTNEMHDASKDFVVTGDTDFIAIFNSDKLYKVTYDLNGGQCQDGDNTWKYSIVKTYAEGDNVTVLGYGNELVKCEKAGYEFEGWLYNDKLYKRDGTAEGGMTGFAMPANDVTLVAQWKQTKPYTVTYDLAGGTYIDGEVSYSEIEAKAYGKGETVTVTGVLPVYGTLEFLGWRNSNDGKLYRANGLKSFAMPGLDVILKAEYAQKYTVKFVATIPAGATYKDSTDTYSGFVTVETAYDGEMLAVVTDPDPYEVKGSTGEKETYYFAGWQINDSDEIWDFADTFDSSKHVDKLTGVLTLTALWSKEKHYTVVFKDKITDMYANGNSDAKEEAQYVLYDGSQLYKAYGEESGKYSDAAKGALTLSSISENTTIGVGDAETGENKYPTFERVDYTLGDSDQNTKNDWYVIDQQGNEESKFCYDPSKSLADNFAGKNIDKYADASGVITLWANWKYKYDQEAGGYQVKIDTTSLESGTYAEYYSDYIVATTDPAVIGGGKKERIYRNFFLTDESGNPYTSPNHSVSKLPEGLYLNKLTGEIYGVPKETGTFTFYVKMESDAKVEAAEAEGAKQISAVYPITITINALPISVDRIDNKANIYDKTYGYTDREALNLNDKDSSKGKAYTSSNLTVTLDDTVLTSSTATDVNGKTSVTLTTPAGTQNANLAFAYGSEKAERKAQIQTGNNPSDANWLACVDMTDVSLDTVFAGFTDTLTFPVVRTKGEDAGSYKLYLEGDAVKYSYQNAAAKASEGSVYELAIPAAFESESVKGAEDKYVFTINPVKLKLSLANKPYTKTYGENDPVYTTKDLTIESTDNETQPDITASDSTALTIKYQAGFTDTLEVAPVRETGEDAKEGYKLSLTDDNITTTATDKADLEIAGERTGADVKKNYTFDLTGYTGNTLTINKRTLTFTASPGEYAYGTFRPKDEVTGTFEAGSLKGLANNEAIGVVDSAIVTITEMASTAGYLKAGEYDVSTEEDGMILNFIITNDKWVEGENNATKTANTVANYSINDLALKITKIDTLKVEGNKVNVTKGKQPTEANIQALATLTGALAGEDKSDVVTLKVVEYVADVDGDGEAKSYTDSEDGKTAAQALIEAIGTKGLTKDLAVKVKYKIDGDDKGNYKLEGGTANATLVAYTASSGGGGGGGAAVPAGGTEKTVNTTGKTTTTLTPASTTVSGVKTTTAAVSTTEGANIITKAVSNNSAEVIITAATGTTVKDQAAGTAAEISIPAATVSQIAEKTGATLTLKTDAANVALDRTATVALAKAAGATGNVTLIVNVIAQDADKVQVELKIKTASGEVSNFNGGDVKVTVKLGTALAAKDVTSVYIDGNGVYHKVSGQKNADGAYTFTTGHFSSYAVMATEDAGKVIAEQAAKATGLTKALSLKARSAKTAKGNIKVTLSVDSNEIKAIEDLGYTVKYKFYRSTKKSKGYQAKLEGTGKTYTNTTGTKGTRYYYKARVMVYNEDGTLVAKSALTQCKYACRIK